MKLNVAKSTFNLGPAPSSQLVTAQVEGQTLKFTLEGVDAQGNLAKAVVVNFGDGTFHPVTDNRAYDAQADINDSTTWVIRTKAGKIVQTLIWERSPDGKTWTVTIAGMTPTGQLVYDVLVREKE